MVIMGIRCMLYVRACRKRDQYCVKEYETIGASGEWDQYCVKAYGTIGASREWDQYCVKAYGTIGASGDGTNTMSRHIGLVLYQGKRGLLAYHTKME